MANQKIVYIEHNKEIRDNISAYLQNEGLEVFSACNGNEGLKQFREIMPTVLVSDHLMPETNSLEILNTVKTESPDTEVVIISTSHNESHRQVCLNQGTFQYLFNPSDPVEIGSVIKHAIELAELRDRVNRLDVELQQSLTQSRTEDLAKFEKGVEPVENKVQGEQKEFEINRQFMEQAANLHKAILDNTYFGIVIVQDINLLWWNRRFEEILGYQWEDIWGKHFDSFFLKNNDFFITQQPAPKFLKKKEFKTLDCRLKHSDSSFVWCQLRGKTIDIDDIGKGVIWIVENIEDRKKTEEELHKYKFMANTSKDFMTMINRNYKYEAVNDAFQEAQNIPKQRLVGTSLADLWGMAAFQRTIKPRLDSCFNGKVIRYENAFNFGTLGEKHVDVAFYPYKDESGKIIAAVAISHDITALKRSEAALIESKQKAEEATQLKTDFINTVSHELRTPLTVILANIPFLTDLEELPEPEEIIEIAQDIEEAGKHLLEIVNDLLDFSKIEAGKLELKKTRLSVLKIMEEIHSTTTILTAAKSLYHKQEVEELTILADPVRIKQILLNLISNAVKFTDKGGITISVKKENDYVIFKVNDTGCGIEENDLPRVFDIFHQLDNSLTRPVGGTGLGLGITKRLVEMHGGSITVESKIGIGSTFTFTIPVE